MKTEELLERIEDRLDKVRTVKDVYGISEMEAIMRLSWIVCLNWVKDQIKELREGVEEEDET